MAFVHELPLHHTGNSIPATNKLKLKIQFTEDLIRFEIHYFNTQGGQRGVMIYQ